MNRTFKTLLLWIIMIALPMQATAAVVKASCGSGHHAMQVQAAIPDHAMLTHAHDHERADHGKHGATHAHSDHASASADLVGKALSDTNMPDAAKSASHHGHSTCSACAACCVGAVAPPSAQVKTPAFSAFIKSAIASSTVLAGFIPAGLERPPRSFLA